MLFSLVIRFVTGFALIVLLAACDNRNPEIIALEDYRQRIHNILELQQALQAFETKRYPAKRELKLTFPEVKMSWSEFFKLTECQQLQQVIAERNNQLGKNMEEATQLLYEVNLLKSFSQCKQQCVELSEQQLTAFRTKQMEFKLNVWNNTWASNYWQSLFSHQRVNRATTKEQMSHLISGISTLRQRLNSIEEFDAAAFSSKEWYKAFEIIENSQGLIGSLSFEMQSHINLLEQINVELDGAKEKICRANKKSKEFEYLWNVLNKFYLTDIQKRQAELINITSELTAEFDEWQEYFPEHAEFNSWYQSTFQQDVDSSLSVQLKNQIKQHVVIWQSIQKQCDARE